MLTIATTEYSQEDQILDAFNRAGERGLSSLDLNRIALRYSAVIHVLRSKHGFNIVTKPSHNGHIKQYVLLPN